jgi:hypothetical protein
LPTTSCDAGNWAPPGGIGTARAIARAYSVFVTGRHELGLRQETLDNLAAPAIPPARGFYEACVALRNALYSSMAKSFAASGTRVA